MERKPFLSIIIPAYNCRDYIDRLLLSILHNKLPIDEYEVIIADDKSTDNFMWIVETYKPRMHIKYIQTHRDIHCPGNTREVGLSIASGEWVTFIDNDDMFELYTFDSVKQYIKDNNITHVLCTNFREYNINSASYTRDFIGEGTDTWLHGKFFNMENVIKKYNVHFKEDLFSHEDVYFNSCVLGNLIGEGMDYVYADIFTYKWVNNPKSLSRSYFNTEHFYIETYLGDYIQSISEPYLNLIDKYPEKRQFYTHQILVTMLYAFFYFDSCRYRLGHKNILSKNIQVLHDFKVNICEKLNMTEYDIIDYIYRDINFYYKIKQNAIIGTNDFIETQSFKDFILTI